MPFKQLNQTRDISEPKPGFFKVRLAKGGPYVGAQIGRFCHCSINGGDENEMHSWQETCDRYPHLSAMINGEFREKTLSYMATDAIDSLMLFGDMITEAEYDYLIDDRKWAEENAPHLPEAQPRQKVNILDVSLDAMKP